MRFMGCPKNQYSYPGEDTIHILGTGTCHREGYRFSRFWYKQRYRFSRFLYKERYQFFSIFTIGIGSGMHFQKIGICLKNWYKVIKSGLHFGKIGIERVCF